MYSMPLFNWFIFAALAFSAICMLRSPPRCVAGRLSSLGRLLQVRCPLLSRASNSILLQSERLIFKRKDSKCWHESGERNRLFIVGGNKNGAGTLEMNVEVPLRAGSSLQYEPDVGTLLGTVPKDSVSYYRDTCLSTFIAAVFKMPEN